MLTPYILTHARKCTQEEYDERQAAKAIHAKSIDMIMTGRSGIGSQARTSTSPVTDASSSLATADPEDSLASETANNGNGSETKIAGQPQAGGAVANGGQQRSAGPPRRRRYVLRCACVHSVGSRTWVGGR